ncbi:unnamed protein product [Gordionus sp. m RMFG-2023]
MVQRNRPQNRRSKVEHRLVDVNGTLIISIGSKTWNIPVSGEVTITSYRNEKPYTLQYNDSRIFYYRDINGNYVIRFQ